MHNVNARGCIKAPVVIFTMILCTFIYIFCKIKFLMHWIKLIPWHDRFILALPRQNEPAHDLWGFILAKEIIIQPIRTGQFCFGVSVGN